MIRKSKLAADLLRGLDEIAQYVYGPTATAKMAKTAIKNGLPHFLIGNRFASRRSIIDEWLTKSMKGR